MYSETRTPAPDNYLLERVEYEYALDGDAAGNVTQVVRLVPDPQENPSADPNYLDMLGTHFTYRKNGEVRIITIQEGARNFGTNYPTGDPRVAIWEFRGDGRARYMMRERALTAVEDYAPDFASSVWTEYEGDLPASEYHVTDCDTSYEVVEETHYDLGIAELDFGADQQSPVDDEISYTHVDHLGTTRARTNDALPPTAFERPVYTAFGERIDGTLSSRYGYVGSEGYETFNNLDWGYWDDQNTAVSMPFQHLGARWYDPASGRFLQRDPIGIEGGLNVYEYVGSSPVAKTDPTGLIGVWEGSTHLPPNEFGNPGHIELLSTNATPGEIAADAFLTLTGGRDSWVDRPKTVKGVQYVVRIFSTALSWCVDAPRKSIKYLSRGVTGFSWVLEGLQLW